MNNYRDKCCLFVDNGLFISFAQKLADDFGRVLYWMPGVNGFPRSNPFIVGHGLDGIERIKNLWDHVDEADVFVFADVYFADIQKTLVRMGKRVWGPRDGERLELYRDESKEIIHKLGLPVAPWELVTGLDDLREVLRKREDVWVKVSYVRGDMETWHSMNYDLSEPRLDELEHKLGAVKHIAEFIVEDSINDAVEIGYDGFTVDGRYPEVACFGIEIKDLGYIGTVRPYSELPEPVRYVSEKLTPYFRSQEYRGWMSTEIRWTGKQAFLIDPCARCGSPPSELYQNLFSNWADIIWNGAEGNVVTPEPVAKWGVEAMIHSPWADQNWQAVDFPDEVQPFIKLRNHCMINGRNYVVPQSVGLPEIGAVIGTGDTLVKAIRDLQNHAAGIKGYYLDIKLASIPEAVDEIRSAKEYGIEFSKDPLPSKEELARIVSPVSSD